MNSLRFFLYFLGIVSLNSCISPRIPPSDIPPNYQFNSNNSKGLIAFTVSCNTVAGLNSINIAPIEKSGIKSDKIYYTNFNCNAPSDSLSNPQLKILNFTPGIYKMIAAYNMDAAGDIFTFPISPPIYFRVSTDQLNYLGRYIFKAGYMDHFLTIVEDKSKQDIPSIKQKISNIKDKDIYVGDESWNV